MNKLKKSCFFFRILNEQISNSTNKTKPKKTNEKIRSKSKLGCPQTLNRRSFYSSESLESFDSNNIYSYSSNDSSSSYSDDFSVNSNANNRLVIVTEKLINTGDESINNIIYQSTTNRDEFYRKLDNFINKTFDLTSYESNEHNTSFIDNKELTEDDIDFLMDNTGFNSEQIQRWHVEFLNKCKTGLISFEQFNSYYRILLPKNLNEKSKDEIIKKLFRLFDIDGDGNLNFTEFLVSFWIRCKAPTREKFTWVFNMFDLDRNGNLNYEEIKNALNLCLDMESLDDLLEELNRNKFSPVSSQKSSNTDNTDDSDSLLNETNSIEMPKYLNKKRENYFRKQNSKKTIDEKIHNVIVLLNEFGKNSMEASSTSNSSSSSSDENNLYQKLNLNERKKQLLETIKKIQISRESFIDLCEKHKPLRKILIPISHFYEETAYNHSF